MVGASGRFDCCDAARCANTVYIRSTLLDGLVQSRRDKHAATRLITAIKAAAVTQPTPKKLTRSYKLV
jgi:hypothetical protein